MHNFDYNQMLHFLSVAKHKSFTKASNILNISQPALSRSIQKLEHKITEPLFERLPKELKLTNTGEIFLNKALEIKNLVETTFKEIEQNKNKDIIRLAIIPTIAPYLLPSLLKEFRKLNSQIKIQVREDTTDNIISQCRENEIDLAIVALPIKDKSLNFEALFDDELMLVIPKGHELQSKKTISLIDIENQPFISLDKQHCLSDNIEEYCSRKSIARIEIERTNQITTIQELVALKHGISIIPSIAKRLDKSKQRIYRPFSGEKIIRKIGMLTKPSRYENSSLITFKNFVRNFSI